MAKDSFYIDLADEWRTGTLADRIAQREPEDVISFFAEIDDICCSNYGNAYIDTYTKLFKIWLNERFIRDNQKEEEQTAFKKDKPKRLIRRNNHK